MLLFALWATLLIGALAGAGYSHYHYRVTHNRYYERLFGTQQALPADIRIEHPPRAYLVPVLTLVLVGFLVPMSFII